MGLLTAPFLHAAGAEAAPASAAEDRPTLFLAGQEGPRPGGAPERSADETPPDPWRFLWKDGLFLASPQDQSTLKVGGRMQADFGWPAGREQLERELRDTFDDKVEFRNLRVCLSGQFVKNLEYKAEVSFANEIFTEIQKAYTNISKLREGKPVEESQDLQTEILFSKATELLKARN